MKYKIKLGRKKNGPQPKVKIHHLSRLFAQCITVAFDRWLTNRTVKAKGVFVFCSVAGATVATGSSTASLNARHSRLQSAYTGKQLYIYICFLFPLSDRNHTFFKHKLDQQ